MQKYEMLAKSCVDDLFKKKKNHTLFLFVLLMIEDDQRARDHGGESVDECSLTDTHAHITLLKRVAPSTCAHQ